MIDKSEPAVGEEAPASLRTSAASDESRTWWTRALRKSTSTLAPDREQSRVDANPLLEFQTERGESKRRGAAAPPMRGGSKEATSRPTKVFFVVTGAVVAVVIASGLGWSRSGTQQTTTRAPLPGKLTVDTNPAGVAVVVDGAARGTTPLTLNLAPGAHRLTLRHGADERTVPVNVPSGGEVADYFELAPPAAPASRTGTITVATDPPGARVAIDRNTFGRSPLTVSDLAASDYTVSVTAGSYTAERTVTLQGGASLSLVFVMPKTSTPRTGWIAVTAPFDVQIGENDNVIATGRSAKTMLPAGSHILTVSNEALQYRDIRRVDIAEGKTTALRIESPRVPLNINARPWADVTVDGVEVGQTPLSKVLVTVGNHELIFRHPQLGERRQSVTATARGPNRIAVDLMK